MSVDETNRSRRQLLLTAATLAACGAVASFLPWRNWVSSSTSTPLASQLLRGGFFHRPPNYPPGTYYQASTALQRFAFEWDLNSGKNRIIEVSVPTHIADTHHIDRNLSVLGSQKTSHISLVDWKAGREIATHELPNQSYFYGHSAFTEDGTIMLAPMLEYTMTPGIGVFEFPSLKQIDFIKTEFGPAHQLAQLGNDEFFFGSSTKPMTANAIGLFNLKTRSVSYVNTGFGFEERRTVVAHVKDCGSSLIANVQRDGDNGYLTSGALISFDKTTRTVKTVIDRGALDFNTDMLSIDFDPSTGYAWITVPYQGRIEIWNLSAGSHVRTLKFKDGTRPTAISRWEDRNEVIVTTGHRFFAYDSKTGERREKSEQAWPHHLLDGGHCAHTRIV